MAIHRSQLFNGEISQNGNISNQKKVCFIITPIGDNNSEIRRHIDGIIDQSIMPAIGDKYRIVVAHREYEIGSINDRIIRSIYEADLVIANLTTTNPNVMFELAIRYSHGKPAIVIAEQGTKLPFDVIDENTIFYINDPVGANDLRLKISEYEKHIDSKKRDYGPVYKVINNIPLYNEVESGNEVSSEKMLQYIIDRLDVMEKNVNTLTQDKINQTNMSLKEEVIDCYNLIIEFDSSEQFNKEEFEEKLDEYAIDFVTEMEANKIVCYIRGKIPHIHKAIISIQTWLNMHSYKYSINPV